MRKSDFDRVYLTKKAIIYQIIQKAFFMRDFGHIHFSLLDWGNLGKSTHFFWKLLALSKKDPSTGE